MSAAMSAPMPWTSLSSRQRVARPVAAPPPSRAPARERAVMPRQQPRRRLADLRDAERIDEAVERDAPPLVDRARSSLRGADLAPAFAAGELLGLQAEDVAGLADQLVLPERGDVLLAHPLDVEAVARDEMLAAARPPAPAQIRPPVQRRATSPSSRTARLPQIGQCVGKLIGLAVLRPALQHDARRPAGSRRRRAG